MKRIIFILCFFVFASFTYATNFTIVVLPDMQFYSSNYPNISINQSNWIVNNKDSLNIKTAIYLGDLVDDGDNLTQYENANASISLLDGVVNYTVIRGNHDNVSSNYNKYFNYTRFEGNGFYQGHYPDYNNDNNYANFSYEGKVFLIYSINYCPGYPELINMNNTLKSFPNSYKIIVNHNFLSAYGIRSRKGTYYGCFYKESTGEGIFREVLRYQNNMLMVLSGHILGKEVSRKLSFVNNKPLYQISQNYHGEDNGGNGWLRYYTFDLSNNVIYAYTYSPYLNSYKTDSINQFRMRMY